MTDDKRFDRIEASFDRLMNCMVEFRAEVSGRLQSLEIQTRVIASSQQNLETS
jgi:hypothetical protein